MKVRQARRNKDSTSKDSEATDSEDLRSVTAEHGSTKEANLHYKQQKSMEEARNKQQTQARTKEIQMLEELEDYKDWGMTPWDDRMAPEDENWSLNPVSTDETWSSTHPGDTDKAATMAGTTTGATLEDEDEAVVTMVGLIMETENRAGQEVPASSKKLPEMDAEQFKELIQEQETLTKISNDSKDPVTDQGISPKAEEAHECAICTGELYAKDAATTLPCLHDHPVTTLPCNHIYHTFCIATWERTVAPGLFKCPTCLKSCEITRGEIQEKFKKLEKAEEEKHKEELSYTPRNCPSTWHEGWLCQNQVPASTEFIPRSAVMPHRDSDSAILRVPGTIIRVRRRYGESGARDVDPRSVIETRIGGGANPYKFDTTSVNLYKAHCLAMEEGDMDATMAILSGAVAANSKLLAATSGAQNSFQKQKQGGEVESGGIKNKEEEK